jgi:hypothetical protein
MKDRLMPESAPSPVERCAVCIVGAGIAGLNALFVASRYLSRDQRIILIDRRQRVGGMWVDTYPYVRLHQPHPMFTAGNIEWTLGKDPSYLANRTEVVDHFEHCVDIIKQRVRVDEFLGWEMESDDETDGVVRIRCRSLDGRLLVVETRRLVKAHGLGVMPNDPLEVSSKRVQSVSPDFCDMRGADMRKSDRPVWIIGGGKTAMDTAHALITEYPGREVNLVAGSGTWFSCRDQFFPTGARRWWGGTRFTTLAAEITRRFDGTNERSVWDWHRDNYGTWVTPETGNFLAGVQSSAENKTISDGLNDVIMDHFVDAVDRNGSTEMVLRSGSTKSIEAGSWIVNCTGYLTQRRYPYEPYTSDSGAVLSIQIQSATMHLTSFAGYFMTHLLMLDKLKDVPLYEVDVLEAYEKSRTVFPYVLFAMAQYNLGLISDNVPAKAFSECGLDFDRWYPLPRRMIGAARFMLMHRRERETLRRSLDAVRERFDVRCGPLVH